MDAHNDAGVLQARAGDFPRARAHFEEALRLDPTHQSARGNLQQLERDARAAEEAEG
jgi:Flp pilus assembly protein TadD